MRLKNKVRRFPQWSLGIAVIIATAVGTTLVARELATGEEPPPPNLTPAPPKIESAVSDTCPSPNAAIAIVPAQPGPTMKLGSAAIPIPAGASPTWIPPVGADSGARYAVSLGNSYIVFDERGVIGQNGVAPGDCEAFEPTVAAL